MRKVLGSLGLVLAACVLAACQTTPQGNVNTQKGPESELSSPIKTEAPVDQRDTNKGSVVIAPTIVMPPGGGAADGKTPTFSLVVTIGSKSDGDAKGAGKTESGNVSDSKDNKTDQKIDAKQDNSGVAEALAKTAEAFIATVNPTSEAAALAGQAVTLAKGGKVDEAKAMLAKAKLAKTEAGTAPPPAPPPQ